MAETYAWSRKDCIRPNAGDNPAGFTTTSNLQKLAMYHSKLPVFGLSILALASCQNQPKSANQGNSPARPNILVIMADDLGYSDLGCYGGEIRTPNLDALASQGVRFTQFYNAARCCPSRASLLTGKYPHRVGLDLNGKNLSADSPTLAEILKANGYRTGMSGKWHLSETLQLPDHQEQMKWLGHQSDSAVFAPLATYPSNRGFDEHWGVIWGVVDYFDPFSLVHNEEAIKEVPDDFYMTDFVTDKSVEMIGQYGEGDDPFFLYVAYTAPHWPLHALPEDIARYEGMYDDGWDALRQSRYKRMVEMGLFNPETAACAVNESGQIWDECENKEWEANHMEAHAAMVDRMDQGIGRIIAKLGETGQLDNTLIIFLADNGASYERGYPPGFDRPAFTRSGEKIRYPSDGYDRPGAQNTWGYLGRAWAGAANTPFRYWKIESFEGGICTPMIVHWPAALQGSENTLRHGAGHIIDILPTCLEVAGIDDPTMFDTSGLPDGKSLLPLLRGETTAIHDTLFWEHEGGKAFRVGDWKIAARRGGPWELFDLSADRTETVNLAEVHPEKVDSLGRAWQQFYDKLMN